MATRQFDEWYSALPDKERIRFSRRAKTTRGYIESHLLAPYKIPRPAGMQNLAVASEIFTVGELAAWFYERSLERRATRSHRTGGVT